tara:strand:+ start:253 stop:1380 length:1128 start_codon:yes stop_codon:yes gene_type:complete
MATISIERRELKSGALSFRARVRITKRGKIIDKADKTFKQRATAKSWADKTAKLLEQKQDELSRGVYYSVENHLEEITLSELIDRYLSHPELSSQVGRTKWYVLEALKKYDIGLKIVSQLTPDDLIEHCQFRLSESTQPKPQTVYHDITYLLSVIKVAKRIFKVNASTQYHDEAIDTLVKLRYVGKSRQRNRRITTQELDAMSAELKKRENHRSAKIPYCDILDISLLTAMRLGEICRVLWTDIDHENKTLIIRDRKDPNNKFGNDGEIPLLGDAYSIIMKQKDRKDPNQPNLIFPYNSRSVGAGWQRVRNKLGIPDLRYHDLRREAASRLFEQGFAIERVAKITGHRNINTLFNIYTRLDMKSFSKGLFERNDS